MARHARPWTLERIDQLPEDGNRYELVYGHLLVSPPPSVAHDSIADVLHELILPYVKEQQLGRIGRPRSVVERRSSRTEPDLTVRPIPAALPKEWSTMPLPILVVEVLSPGTRAQDEVRKRTFYLDLGVPDYWMVNGQTRTVTIVRGGRDDVVVEDVLEWHPAGASEPLAIDVRALFRDALRG